MNSPESPFFTKGRILYNFDRAKNIIRQTGTAMIFEGFMDVISADMADQKVGSLTSAIDANTSAEIKQPQAQSQAQSQRLTTRDDFYGEPPQDNYYDQLYEANPQFKNTVSKVELAERALIMAMIKDPQVMRRVKSTAGFAFVHSDYQLLMMLAEVYQRDHIGSFDIAEFMDFLQKPELNQKIMAIDRLFGDLEVKDEAVSDYLR
ncbi:hypothetical protein Pfo_031578 [Paulownia fortunei]|nr:hypothetical protein Pfo_031578 [Paulownia fortunei]